ncbi:MAG: hypothetical protein IKE90_03420 [Bacilli bacterium]|nr:hypothetical protein [Bacilli bacterium]
MKFYNKNNEPLTKEEIEEIKQSPEYRKMISNDLNNLNNKIDKLVLDRDKSDKIIGLVIGTEISCLLTSLTDIIGITEPNDNYSSIRIVLLISSILIRNINMIKNSNRSTKINILNDLKEDLLNENNWLKDQKTLKY